MRSGSVSGWCARRRFRRWTRCTAPGTTASNMTSSRLHGFRLVLPLLLVSYAFAGQPQLFEAVEPHMGTLVRIQIYTSGQAEAKAAFRGAFDRIAELDDILSDYKPES